MTLSQDNSKRMFNDSGKNVQNVNAIKLYVEQGSFRFFWLVDKVKDQTVSDKCPNRTAVRPTTGKEKHGTQQP